MNLQLNLNFYHKMSERNKRSFDDILGMSLLSKYVG